MRAEHGEEAVEELGEPAELREDEEDDLGDDEEAVHDRPEDAGGLVGDCARPEDKNGSQYAETERGGETRRTRCSRNLRDPGRSRLS